MLHFIAALLMVIGQRIAKVRNILQNRTAVSLLSIFTTCTVLFLMTGAFYFRAPAASAYGTEDNSSPQSFYEYRGSAGSQLSNVSYLSNPVISENVNVNTFNVTITADGRTIDVEAYEGETVGELLFRKGFNPTENDRASKDFDSEAYAGMKLTFIRVEFIDTEIRTPIPYSTQYESSNLIAMGTTEVRVAGVEGAEVITIREIITDGVSISLDVISTEQIEPVTEVLVRGNALATPYSKRDFDEIILENGLPVNYERIISGPATAYTALPTSGTASGRKLEVGTVAVNPAQIPYGSLLYIVARDGTVYGAAVAACTGTFVGTTDIIVDVFKGVHNPYIANARAWGIKQVDIYIINTGVH